MLPEVTSHAGSQWWAQSSGGTRLGMSCHCGRFVHLGASGHIYWAVSGGRAVCPGVLNQAHSVLVTGLCIWGSWVMMAVPGTPRQGNGASHPRALGWVCWFRAGGPCVQAGHVSRWQSRLGTGLLMCVWYRWVPCVPIWWGRPHALPVKATSQSSEALSSGAWSCCLVCVSWVMVTGLCICGSWVTVFGSQQWGHTHLSVG